MQAAGLDLPRLGDLRRHRQHLRLRALRRAPEAQRDGRVVARDGAGARRHRRPGLGDHPAPAHVGGLRAPGRLHRPAGRLPHVQAALPGRPSGRAAVRAQALGPPGGGQAVRPHRGARLQPDVRDHDRPREGGRRDGLPAPGDGAGHLPRLQADAAVRAPAAAVRDRPGRQVVPQRDHAGQLHLPHARVRADGDGVLRAPRSGAAVVRVLVRRAPRLVRAAGDRPRAPAPAPA